MIVGYMYVLLLLAVIAVAAPFSERQSPANIFARGWAENCPTPTWGHTYGESYVQETLAILRDKMNKKCVKSALKSEAQNYKPVFVKDKDKNVFKCYPANFMTTLPNPSEKVIDKLNETPGCKTGQRGKAYLEFPIGEDHYTGGKPGPHRILAIVDSRQGQFSNVRYCLTMYHVGEGPEFLPCTRYN